MALKPVACPYCKKQIEVFSEDVNKGFCPFCDSVIENIQELQHKYKKQLNENTSKSIYNEKKLDYIKDEAFDSIDYLDMLNEALDRLNSNEHDWEAWFLKGKAVGFLSSIEYNRFSEAANCFTLAYINYEGNKEHLLKQINDELLLLCLMYFPHLKDDIFDFSKIEIGIDSIIFNNDIPNIEQYFAIQIHNSIQVLYKDYIYKDLKAINSNNFGNFPTIEQYERYIKRAAICIHLMKVATSMYRVENLEMNNTLITILQDSLRNKGVDRNKSINAALSYLDRCTIMHDLKMLRDIVEDVNNS